MDTLNGVELLQKVREITNLTNYGISKELRALGIEVTTQGIDHYSKAGSRSMRLDVLGGLYRLCAKKGVGAKQFMEWVTCEFMSK